MYKTLKTILIFSILGTTALFAQPKLEIIGGDTYNWGTVKPTDNPLKAKIVIKNAGDKLLTIDEIRPGCSCTSSPITKSEIAPGDTASMSVTLSFNSGNDIVKSIKISSNDPANSPKYLFLKASVYYPVVITPYQYFAFNECEVGKSKDTKLTIMNNSKNSLTLSDFITEPKFISVNVMGKKILAPGEKFDLIATVIPTKSGLLNGVVKFRTTDSEMKEVSIQVYGKVNESPINLEVPKP